jgi:hydroxyethylthiazole kinase-like uncharacterized protein yjeF
MTSINQSFQELHAPNPDSHKGQNGKLLIIGGSELFHAASKWSLDVASKIVDMVFYSSVPENNELIKEAKQNFWNGIVINRSDVDKYIDEADCVLIGPGMDRSEETEKITNELISNHKNKKVVIDAGALQMVDINLLNSNHIISPHQKEMSLLKEKGLNTSSFSGTILLKGEFDEVIQKNERIKIEGGNPGMTKGGTGDVLAGLVSALYCKNSALNSCIVGSFVNKKAGDRLSEKVGPYFNASDLVEIIPEILWSELGSIA